MDVTSIGPSGLDPFTVTPASSPEEDRDQAPVSEPREAAPLPEGSGTLVDTSV